MAKNKTKGRGRPTIIPWAKVTLQWKNLTDKEIQVKLQALTPKVSNVVVTIPAVNNKRKALMAAAEKAGKNPDFYVCRKGKYARVG